MLIVRAPLRVSLFGGGTDLPAYYARHGGAVLSTTIDKYVYVVLNVNERNALQITSSDYRTFYRHGPGEPLLWNGDLALPRAVLEHFGVDHGVSMFLASEVPPGTGLGSSSAVTVALVKAVSSACGIKMTAAEIAALACEIEIDKVGSPVGVQDQYAAAYGGLNWMTFGPEGVSVEPLGLSSGTLRALEDNLLLMFTGSARDSGQILSRQREASSEQRPEVIEALGKVHALALEAKKRLLAGDIYALGGMLDEAWQHKKRFANGVTNERIDSYYDIARRNGAVGGKITGAGGGGFLLLYCPPGKKDRVGAALTVAGLRRMDFGFEHDGARVLFNAGLRLRSVPGALSVPSGTLESAGAPWRTVRVGEGEVS